MLDAAGDKEGFQKASTLLKQRESALKNYCESTGRTYKSDRVQVSGFNRSVSAKATTANKAFTAQQKSDMLISKLKATKAIPQAGVIHLTPTPIDMKTLQFDDVHVNTQRLHNVTQEQAIGYIKNASFSVTVWQGKYERYYSLEGAAYVDTQTHLIRTAYSKAQFDDKTKAMMEVFEQNEP